MVEMERCPPRNDFTLETVSGFHRDECTRCPPTSAALSHAHEAMARWCGLASGGVGDHLIIENRGGDGYFPLFTQPRLSSNTETATVIRLCRLAKGDVSRTVKLASTLR